MLLMSTEPVLCQCYEQNCLGLPVQSYSSQGFLAGKERPVNRKDKNKGDREKNKREEKYIYIFSNRYQIRYYITILNFSVYGAILHLCILMNK